MKYFVSLIIIFSLSSFSLEAQNCGQVVDFRSTITNLGNGQSSYAFEVDIAATSGGSKSVLLTISCPNNMFVNMDCQESFATTTTIFYGPFTGPSCTGPIFLEWTGHSNSTCGGATCAGSTLSLPVELSFFQGTLRNEKVDLHWITASEINNAGFEVQKLNESRNWMSLAWIGGSNNSSTEIEYRFTDEKPTIGNNYYRLKQVDLNGEYSYSDIVTVKVEADHFGSLVYPNPVTDFLYFQDTELEFGQIKIMDQTGNTVEERSLTWQPIDLSHLTPGIYFVVIFTSKEPQVERITKL